MRYLRDSFTMQNFIVLLLFFCLFVSCECVFYSINEREHFLQQQQNILWTLKQKENAIHIWNRSKKQLAKTDLKQTNQKNGTNQIDLWIEKWQYSIEKKKWKKKLFNLTNSQNFSLVIWYCVLVDCNHYVYLNVLEKFFCSCKFLHFYHQ